jgi:Zn-dependent protease with chaperone function
VAIGAFASVLTFSFMMTGATLARIGTRLRGLVGADPPTPGRHAVAASVLHDVSMAAGLTEMPRLYVFPSAYPNGFGYTEWSGLVVVGLSTGLVGGLGADEMRAVVAHLVARAQAPAARWLLLATTATERLAEMSPFRRYASGVTPNPRLAMAVDVGLIVLVLPWVPLSMLVLLIWLAGLMDALAVPYSTAVLFMTASVLLWGLAMSVLLLVVCVPPILKVLTTALLPSIDEWGDSKGLYYLRDPGGMLRAMQAVLRSDNCAAAGPYFAHFFAPPDWGRAAYRSEERRIRNMESLLGAEGVVARPATPLVDDSSRVLEQST